MLTVVISGWGVRMVTQGRGLRWVNTWDLASEGCPFKPAGGFHHYMEARRPSFDPFPGRGGRSWSCPWVVTLFGLSPWKKAEKSLSKLYCWRWEHGAVLCPRLGSHNGLLLHWPALSVEWKGASFQESRALLSAPLSTPLFQNLQQGPCSLELETCGWSPQFPSPPRGSDLRKSAAGFYCQIFLSLGGQRIQTAQWRLELVQP